MTDHLPCTDCGCNTPDLVTGAVIYPHRPDLADKPIWLCPCGAYCGCHPGTQDPLGSTAGPETRNARSYVHRVLDPLWRTIPDQYKGKGKLEPHQLRSMMRRRVYRYLAAEMGISEDDCHTGMFSIEQCRQAYAILKNTTYTDVRRWVKEQQKREKTNG
ncbi:MAG: hypothetical protein GYB49_09315 [Alphaproteobacteria bacterium]|nr:hypothetical protein [Alphaproteobacteria bacterium]